MKVVPIDLFSVLYGLSVNELETSMRFFECERVAMGPSGHVCAQPCS